MHVCMIVYLSKHAYIHFVLVGIMNLCVCVSVCVCMQTCLMKISELAEPGQDQNVEEDWGAQQAEKRMLSA